MLFEVWMQIIELYILGNVDRDGFVNGLRGSRKRTDKSISF